jgi:hypothetical protein
MSCLPPALHDPVAEAWAVASALVHPVCPPEALEFYHGTRQLLPAMLREAKSEDFLDPLARQAWQVISELAQREGLGAVNQLTVSHELLRRGVRGPLLAKLSEWVTELPTPLLGLNAARIVRQCAERRRRLHGLQREAEALARGGAPSTMISARLHRLGARG